MPFFQEFIISLAFIKKRAKALTIRVEIAIVITLLSFLGTIAVARYVVK